ncbi:MAG: carboxypeptidase regulatory-like domain-containing protein [Myxococcota bacterium]
MRNDSSEHIGGVVVVDHFRLQGTFDEFRLRLTNGPRALSEGQSELANRAFFELRVGLEQRDPGVLTTALQIVEALDGQRAPQLRDLSDAFIKVVLLRRLEDVLQSGRLLIECEQIASLTEREEPAPELEPLPVSRPPREPKSFDVKVIDDTGVAVSGIDVNLIIDDTPETIRTSRAGCAHGEGLSSSTARLRMLEVDGVPRLLEPRWVEPRSPKLPKGADVGEVLAGERFEPLSVSAGKPFTLILRRPPVRRVRMLGMLFDANKCFLLPQALPGILRVVALHRERPNAKIMVVGHAGGDEDLKGADIALDRADIVASYLTGQTDVWLAWFKKNKPERSRWGTREVQLMLSALPRNSRAYYEGYASGVTDADTRRAIKNFQAAQGITPDGKAGGGTLKALVHAYLALEGTTLTPGVEPTTHGCEGHFDDDLTTDGFEPDDRRLDVFFFDWEISPAPAGKVSSAGAPQYAAWRGGLVSTTDFEHHGIHVQIIDAKKKPVPFAEVHLDGPKRGDAVADAHGFVSFEGLKPGEYTLSAQKRGMKVGTYKVKYPTAKTVPGHRRPKSKKPARTAPNSAVGLPKGL